MRQYQQEHGAGATLEEMHDKAVASTERFMKAIRFDVRRVLMVSLRVDV